MIIKWEDWQERMRIAAGMVEKLTILHLNAERPDEVVTLRDAILMIQGLCHELEEQAKQRRYAEKKKQWYQDLLVATREGKAIQFLISEVEELKEKVECLARK